MFFVLEKTPIYYIFIRENIRYYKQRKTSLKTTNDKENYNDRHLPSLALRHPEINIGTKIDSNG
jgi:hypothetical protein